VPGFFANLSDVPWGLVVVVLALFLMGWARKRSLAARGRPVDTTDPRWTGALEKARSTIPVMRELYAQPGIEVFVKYPLESSSKEIEHVWGQLEGVNETHMSVSLETPLVTGKSPGPPPYKIALADLEDWQVMLPDGRIRGGFTTQLMIAMARESGAAPPAQIAAMKGKFVDV
jgi:hypothetical protein